MPKIFDVVKAAGTYTDASGQEKTRWINCGMIVKNPESGKLSLKLDSLPLGTPSEAGVGITPTRRVETGELAGATGS